MTAPKRSFAHLNALRRRFPAGLSTEQMCDILTNEYGDPIMVPTLRRYVQLGLVERSTRRSVGGSGSKGFYPVTALVQLLRTHAQVKKHGLPATWARGSTEVHRHLDNMRETLEQALSRLILLSRQERRSASMKPHLVRLRAVISEAIDELGDIAESGVDEGARHD